MNDEHGFDKNLQLFSHIQILSFAVILSLKAKGALIKIKAAC